MFATEGTGVERLNWLTSIKINPRESSKRGFNYAVLSDEEVLFNLIEGTEGLGLFSSGSSRAFRIDGVDNTGSKVFSLRRPGGMFGVNKVELFMNGALAGVVRQQSSFFKSIFSINDARDSPILRLKGESNEASDYKLQNKSKNIIGSIRMKNAGMLKQLALRNDKSYVITFPADLGVHLKLTVIAACVLINFKKHKYQ